MELSEMLISHTVANSGYDSHRDYFGLSQLHKDPEDIIETRIKGFPSMDTRGHLRCYKGYQMEKDILDRLAIVAAEQQVRFSRGLFALIVVDGVEFRGHYEFSWDDAPGDVKSVPYDQHLPNGKVPYKTYSQIQSYMLAAGANRGHVIYESRESGIIRSWSYTPNPNIQDKIMAKMQLIAQLWNEHRNQR